MNIEPRDIEAVAAKEERELARRDKLYRGVRPRPNVKGVTVILVDDGLATGATMRAAVAALRRQGARAHRGCRSRRRRADLPRVCSAK